MSVVDPYWQDTEQLSVEELVKYLKESVERAGNLNSIMASFACNFGMGVEFEKKYPQIKEKLESQGYKCTFKREFSTCPTGMFSYCCVKKL